MEEELTVTEKLIRLDQKLQALEKKKEQMETKLALSFLKKTQKIVGEEFSLSMVLVILDNVWALASEIQKQEWEKSAPSFRSSLTNSTGKKTSPASPTHHQG